jgi:hypothetical protein
MLSVGDAQRLVDKHLGTSPDTPYLCDILQQLAGKHALPFPRIVEIVRDLG